MKTRSSNVPSIAQIPRAGAKRLPRRRFGNAIRPVMECFEERIALTISYAIAPGTTLDIFPISSIIPAAPAGMDRMEVNLNSIPGVAHGTIYRVSGLSAYQWGSGAPNFFTIGSPNNRIFGGEGFRYVNNGTGSGTTESIPVKFRDSTGFNSVTDTIVIKIDANLKPPTITTQPNPFIQIPPGAQASMSVVASGDAPLKYQWYTGFAPNTANPIGGATSATYTTPPLSVVQQYPYWVRVSNSGGHVDSDNVTVQVATATSVVTSNVSTPYKTTTRNVTLSATVTPAENVGKVTFTSLALGAATADSGTVTNGKSGNTAFPVPGGYAVGNYSFDAHYVAPAGIADSTDTKTITITRENTTTVAANKTALANANAQSITLSATVTSPAGPVNEGTVTFTLKDGAVTIGSATTSGTVTNGAASVSYNLPGNSRAGVYTINAVFNQSTNLNTSSDATHTLSEAPVITSSTANLLANASTLVVNGAGFDTTAANNTLTFPSGISGIITGITPTQLTIGNLSGLVAGALNLSVTTRTVLSGAAVQVATVIPVITSSTAALPVGSTSMTINGFGFSPTAANNSVLFGGTVVGTVTAATKTQLTVTGMTGVNTVGSLTAVAKSNAQSSASVQVATIVPVVTTSNPTIPANTTSLTINGLGFSTTASDNVVTLSGGATGTVTAATATQLTVSVSNLTGGALNALVTVKGIASVASVKIATVVPIVTSSTAFIAPNSSTIIIKGFGFDSTLANNSVTFTPAAAGSVTFSSPTQITYTFSGPPLAIGVLKASVTVNGLSSGAPVQVATVAVLPVATSGKFNLDSPLFGTLSVQISANIDPALLLSHFQVDSTDGPAATYFPASVIQDTVTHLATFKFSPKLPNHNYAATLTAAGLTDLNGNPLAADFKFAFFALNGDANRDRSVGFADLVAVAQHYGQSNMTYDKGDVDGDGAVGFADLVMVAQNYGTSLPVPAAIVPAAASASLAPVSSLKSPTLSVFSQKKIEKVVSRRPVWQS